MRKIGIIGCGNMGEAILRGIISNELTPAGNIVVCDKDSTKLNRIKNHYNVEATFNGSVTAAQTDVIIVAVKPQDIKEALSGISGNLGKKKLLISIAAGVTIKSIRSIVGNDTPVARAMPNMPAFIRMGFSALALTKNVDRRSVRLAMEIFGSIGDVVKVDESDLNAITALSGSGPAYFFYLIESLIEGGVKLGLSRNVAKKAAIRTALGSIELINRFGEEPAALRKKVTSKGGTTEAAFKVFKRNRLGRTIESGLRAAKKKSEQLSGG